MLALKEVRNYYTGQVTYEADLNPKYKPPIGAIQYLIVDESSMLDNMLFNQLVPWIKKGLKVLFIGDPAQIPPVNHKDSIPFLKAREWGMLEAELTEIIRQKEDNPILEYVTRIRGNYKRGSFPPTTQLRTGGDEGVQVVGRSDEEKIFEDYFGCEQFRRDAYHMKVIAWRNATVDRYNRQIREVIYGPDVPGIIRGEKLVMDESVVSGGKVLLSRNEDLDVVGVETMPASWDYTHMGEDLTLDGEVYKLQVRWVAGTDLKEGTINVLHESTRDAFNKVLQNIRTEAFRLQGDGRRRAWKQFFQLQGSVAWVNYGYAITAHKAQGSSYENCLVLKWDLDANRDIEERNRLLYTACTRPRHLLMIEP